MRLSLTASSSLRSASLFTGWATSWGNPRRRSPKPSPEEKVCAARLESREVDGHVNVAQLAELAHDRRVPAVFPEPRHLVGRDLEPRQPLVVTDAELPEAERADDLLGRVHLAQLRRGDLVAVLEARRE